MRPSIRAETFNWRLWASILGSRTLEHMSDNSCKTIECCLAPDIFYHLTEKNGILQWNAKLHKGLVRSISHELATGIVPSGAVTAYGYGNQNSETEVLWEKTRQTQFAYRPTRKNALFLFDTREDAQRAQEDWFRDEARSLVRARIVAWSAWHRGDARWLDEPSAETARSYWRGDMTEDPRVEIVVDGQVYFPDWRDDSVFGRPVFLSR